VHVVVVVLGLAAAVVTGAPAARGAEALRCNGSANLCELPLGDVAFATTHNSMSSAHDGFRGPNQGEPIDEQLRHGIRGFQIDAYLGTPTRGRVLTDLPATFPDRATQLPGALVATAERLHRQLGEPAPGTPNDVYLCHTFCEIGAIEMRVALRQVRAFLDRNPNEVLAFVIEDYVPPARLLAQFEEAGLASRLLHVEPGSPLPTLGEMVRSGRRLLVTLENGDGGPSLPNAFSSLVEETPFTFLTTSELRGPASCAPNRGPAVAPILQFNHWVTPAGARRALAVNFRPLRSRAAACVDVRGRAPTLVAVDFAERSDVLRVVHDLNEEARP
jgi:hypothetical protein